jgi:hypothetical protein
MGLPMNAEGGSRRPQLTAAPADLSAGLSAIALAKVEASAKADGFMPSAFFDIFRQKTNG